MSYCINPQCEQRENPAAAQNCQACGTALLIADRYRILKPVRSPNPARPTDILEVEDLGTGDNEWGTVKVLKVLKHSHNPDLLRLFQQAARVLIWLAGQARVPQVEPDGYFQIKLPNNSQKLCCLVMEKIDGENLTEFLTKNQHVSQTLVIDWLQQMLHILQQIHKYHLVHRDIKPSNLMLTADGKLRLIDFGCATEAGTDTAPIGTAGYSAPEQIAGKPEVRSDFFSLGRTFVHLLTGIPAIDFPVNPTTGKINWRNQALDVDQSFVEAIDQLMEPLPENRPENTQVILETLKNIDLLITSTESN
ncbi:serine/threonine-protein kinase [Microcoleus sp. bin38.metabat.b11b12b14.051]|uniref:serine/threonine-protein kinase n=1 Tax=Microcoleus sp. bin38.metabat.b11b12b14.051 TaxID=2742709 RepID=UPI0025CFF014|nr:serine/threonine-protein kinase [Microcoleus sp. bin38.metabat.b11b12b14.051]